MTESTSPEELIRQAIREEALRGFEGIKAAAQQALQATADEAKKNIDNVIAVFLSTCEEIRESTANRTRKELRALEKEQLKQVTQIEKESIRIINDTWSMSKSNLQRMLQDSKSTLGKASKELEKLLNEMIKSMSRVIDDFVRMIKTYSKMAQAQLKQIGKEVSKNM